MVIVAEALEVLEGLETSPGFQAAVEDPSSGTSVFADLAAGSRELVTRKCCSGSSSSQSS